MHSRRLQWIVEAVIIGLCFFGPATLGYWMGGTAERWKPTPRGREIVCDRGVLVSTTPHGLHVARCAQEAAR